MSRSSVLAPVAALLAMSVVGCSDTPAGPGVDGVQLSRDLTLEQLGSALDAAPSRVEITLLPGTLVAREVEVEGDDEDDDRESVRARVTAVSGTAGGGSLTLEIGGLVVDFDATTRFRDDDDDLTGDDFIAAIQAALAAGQQPFVRARRPAPAEAQAPDDASFLATDIRIRDEADEPKIEMLVDGDNLELNDAPPPDAFLTVLGLAIEIRASTGETEIEGDANDDDESEFEDLVASVDVAAGSVTLASGAVVLVVAETRIEQPDDDGDDDEETLGTLEAVAAALAAGLPVEVEGEGTVQATDPLTIVAREIEFEVEDEDDGDDQDDEGDDDGQN